MTRICHRDSFTCTAVASNLLSSEDQSAKIFARKKQPIFQFRSSSCSFSVCEFKSWKISRDSYAVRWASALKVRRVTVCSQCDLRDEITSTLLSISLDVEGGNNFVFEVFKLISLLLIEIIKCALQAIWVFGPRAKFFCTNFYSFRKIFWRFHSEADCVVRIENFVKWRKIIFTSSESLELI